ncbi:hypothetical protein HK099_004218 [Clydaea vesicula]|uniref:SF3 helicase domain-containing protein n=1 Tax=Clydaea vesicula TaxID=447962 RepID=A0AAD5U0I7_9FUNG|nr:hypothetical protein HK099_004218 [Clydaea vesicula]
MVVLMDLETYFFPPVVVVVWYECELRVGSGGDLATREFVENFVKEHYKLEFGCKIIDLIGTDWVLITGLRLGSFNVNISPLNGKGPTASFIISKCSIEDDAPIVKMTNLSPDNNQTYFELVWTDVLKIKKSTNNFDSKSYLQEYVDSNINVKLEGIYIDLYDTEFFEVENLSPGSFFLTVSPVNHPGPTATFSISKPIIFSDAHCVSITKVGKKLQTFDGKYLISFSLQNFSSVGSPVVESDLVTLSFFKEYFNKMFSEKFQKTFYVIDLSPRSYVISVNSQVFGAPTATFKLRKTGIFYDGDYTVNFNIKNIGNNCNDFITELGQSQVASKEFVWQTIKDSIDTHISGQKFFLFETQFVDVIPLKAELRWGSNSKLKLGKLKPFFDGEYIVSFNLKNISINPVITDFDIASKGYVDHQIDNKIDLLASGKIIKLTGTNFSQVAALHPGSFTINISPKFDGGATASFSVSKSSFYSEAHIVRTTHSRGLHYNEELQLSWGENSNLLLKKNMPVNGLYLVDFNLHVDIREVKKIQDSKKFYFILPLLKCYDPDCKSGVFDKIHVSNYPSQIQEIFKIALNEVDIKKMELMAKEDGQKLYLMNMKISSELDFECEIELDSKIFQNDTLTKLYSEILDGHKVLLISHLLYITEINFVYSNGDWYEFSNSIWKLDRETGSLKKKTLGLIENFRKIKKFYLNLNSVNNQTYFEKIIKNVTRLINKMYLVGMFRKSVKEDYIFFTMDYEYDTTVHNHEIYEFLEKVLPDQYIREYVLKRMSDCLNKDFLNTLFLIFIGEGANGKLLSLMKYNMGGFEVKIDSTLITRKRPDANSASPAIIKLKDKRFALFSEPSENEPLNMAIIKKLTGDEDGISGRELHKGIVDFKVEAKFFLGTNTLPKINGSDAANWRRVKTVPFKSEFVDFPEKHLQFKKDKTLPSRMKTDVTWQVSRSTNEYRSENNELEQWVLENVRFQPNGVLEQTDLNRRRFGNDFKNPRSKGVFRKEFEKCLKKLGENIQGFDHNLTDSNTKVWKGVELV